MLGSREEALGDGNSQSKAPSDTLKITPGREGHLISAHEAEDMALTQITGVLATWR